MAFQEFITADEGAVTIDWVALAAGLLILGVAMVSLLQDEVQTIVNEMELIYLTADDVSPPAED
ncbi:MAG: hypothetical protein AAFR84_16435 [Pseudomonadota bacterium]